MVKFRRYISLSVDSRSEKFRVRWRIEEVSVKESREQPKNGALKQAIEK